jgi:hypothetical protein
MTLGGVNISNVATATVQMVADPLFENSTIWGIVFNDRDGDGWQDHATAKEVQISGGFAPSAYIPNSTMVDRGDGPQPEPDASAPMLHGIALGDLSGRSTASEKEDEHKIVITQKLKTANFTDDFALSTAEGTTLKMSSAGKTTVEKEDDAKNGLTAEELRVVRNVTPSNKGYVIVSYEISNAGIDERGLPGVRIGTVEGLLVETDAYGRFHLAGIDVSRIDRGRNFLMKVDTVTLPYGSVFTTDNPQLKRITQGLPTRFDFGVKIPERIVKPSKTETQKNSADIKSSAAVDKKASDAKTQERSQ